MSRRGVVASFGPFAVYFDRSSGKYIVTDEAGQPGASHMTEGAALRAARAAYETWVREGRR